MKLLWIITAGLFMYAVDLDSAPAERDGRESVNCDILYGDAARLMGRYKQIPIWNNTKAFIVDATCSKGVYSVVNRGVSNTAAIAIAGVKFRRRYRETGFLYDVTGCYMGPDLPPQNVRRVAK